MLSMISRNPFDNLQAGIVAIWLVNQNLGGDAERFPDDVLRIVVVVQNALK